jgi:polyhydroxyalkanoate synthase
MNSAASGINNGDFTYWDPLLPSADDVQAWTDVVQKAQSMVLDFALTHNKAFSNFDSQLAGKDHFNDLSKAFTVPENWAAATASMFQPAGWMTSPATQLWADHMLKMWQQGTDFWTNSSAFGASSACESPASTGNDSAKAADTHHPAPRFAEWQDHPAFAIIRQSYALLSDQWIKAAHEAQGLDEASKSKLIFAVRGLTDALSPSNLAITNPDVLQRAIETRGESLLKGLRHMLDDLARGQLSHVDRSAFEIGVNIAATPGKVVHETDLYQLIHYQPTTDAVRAIPLLIFPPWINRFYILDLNPQKSFVRWALDQGLSVFMVSWKSADASMAELIWDDYVLAQVDAIETVRKVLNVPSVHCIGYCVAGTTLACTLAMLAAKGQADIVKSVTFFTAQVDFELAGDLKNFVDENSLDLLKQLSSQGFLDGRYMAATFNALRGRDLIWNYVINHYLLGQDYPAFDLLYWNGDTTNLPAKWHQQYLTDLYHRNLLVQPKALTIDGTAIDLRLIKTPIFVQAGREDHIAPLASVWRIMDHVSGPAEFVIAGSGHIAGVVNPPSSGKYQYWTGDSKASSLDAFEASARETKGSWWPYWLQWLTDQDDEIVSVKGARLPGKGKYKAIEDAPGRYVRTA